MDRSLAEEVDAALAGLGCDLVELRAALNRAKPAMLDLLRVPVRFFFLNEFIDDDGHLIDGRFDVDVVDIFVRRFHVFYRCARQFQRLN